MVPAGLGAVRKGPRRGGVGGLIGPTLTRYLNRVNHSDIERYLLRRLDAESSEIQLVLSGKSNRSGLAPDRDDHRIRILVRIDQQSWRKRSETTTLWELCTAYLRAHCACTCRTSARIDMVLSLIRGGVRCTAPGPLMIRSMCYSMVALRHLVVQ